MDSLFERLLREKIQLMMDMRIESITVSGCDSFDAYRMSLGYIEALRQVLNAMEEVQTDIREH
jgi:hypothetical protein